MDTPEPDISDKMDKKEPIPIPDGGIIEKLGATSEPKVYDSPNYHDFLKRIAEEDRQRLFGPLVHPDFQETDNGV